MIALYSILSSFALNFTTEHGMPRMHIQKLHVQ